MVRVVGDKEHDTLIKRIRNDYNISITEKNRFAPEMTVIPGRHYEMGKYLVTQAEWEAVMGYNPSRFKGANLPVESVSWNNVQEYITKLTEKTDIKYRLPTESEWEYAYHSGSRAEFCGNLNMDAVAWHNENSNHMTHPVGEKQPNAFGLYDMNGNVWEWLDDCEESDWQGNCKKRVLRGGSWINELRADREAHRSSVDPARHNDGTGFRLARSLPQ
jgi:formylglycine-generating enzyme required for sulfatase activity